MVHHQRRVQNDRSRTRRQSARSLSKPADRIHLLQHLQSKAGNRAVTQLTRELTLQPKLTVTPAGDVYEQEADHVADQVLQQLNSGAAEHEVQRQEEEEEEMQMKREVGVQRQEVEEEELMMQRDFLTQRQEIPEEEETLQMQPDGRLSTTDSLTSAVQQSQGKGHTLAEQTRRPLERAFGADFENVRIHADAEADQMSRSMQARAFTVGSDIYFRQNTYTPQSTSGQRLLAHELTHVIQQGFAPTQSELEEQSETNNSRSR